MKKGLLFLFVAVFAASCADNRINEITNNNCEADQIYASIDDFDEETRVELNDNKQTVWTAGDEIITFYSDAIKLYKFNGNTGDRAGSFSYMGTYDYTNSNIIYDQHYAVYLADLSIAYLDDGSPVFVTTLPATQEYKEQSYGLNTNAMLGSSNDSKNFKFKNLFSYLRLSITGDKVVKNIVIEGNNDETLTGQFYILTDGSLMWREAQSQTITLDCGAGVPLSDIPTEFYITIPPLTLNKGINVTITFTDGTVYPKKTSKTIAFSRNTIQPMATFDTNSDNTVWQTININHSGSKIYAPYLFGSSALSGIIYWGDDYMSEVNTVESYTYDDGQPSHTVTIKSMNATTFVLYGCTGVSEIDLSNF